MSTGIAIVGVGETKPVRRSNRTAADLIYEAVDAALADAGLTGSDVDGVLSEGTVCEAVLPGADLALRLGAPPEALTAQLSIGASGIVGAPLMAAALIDAGLATTVVVYFGATWGTNPSGPSDVHGADPYKSAFEVPRGYAGQPVYFAAMAARYAHEYGLTEEQTGGLAIATREWARLHPSALKREPLDLETYLRSPMIAEPMRALDCCLLTDGAAAFVMTSVDRAADCAQFPVEVAGCALSRSATSQHGFFTQRKDFLSSPARDSGPRALGRAGLGISDVDVAEIYDCFTITVIGQLEDLGVCGRGEGAAFVGEGRTAPGGQLPTNTHGGLLSHSYIGGINHVVEAVQQVRRLGDTRQVRGAEVALVTGYSAAEHATLVLTR